MSTTPAVDPFRIYLKYAAELDEIEPVVALCCRTHYIQRLIESKQRARVEFTPVESAFMSQLLGFVEASRQNLGLGNDARRDRLDAFCSRLFLALENEEQTAEKLTKDLAARLFSTGRLIELLGLFGPLSPMWEDRSIPRPRDQR